MKSASLTIIYLLRCADKSVYVGETTNLEVALIQHFNKEVNETAKRLPVDLRSYLAFKNRYQARLIKSFLSSFFGRLLLRRLK